MCPDSPENKCPDPVINLDSDLRPVSVSIPCPATVEAVLGLPEPVTLPCGKLDGHDGEHEYWIGWTDCACSDCRGRGEIEGYEFNPFYSEHSGPVVDKCSACGGSGRINTSGPDDSKIESKYQGASPSVPPAVTTDGVPVVREGREEESRFCEPGVCPCCDAPSVVSGGGQNEARIGEMTGELNRLITAEVESRLRTYVLPPDEVTVGREARIELLKYIDRIEEFIGLVPGWVIDLWNSTDPDLPQSLRDQWRESGLAALDKKGQDDG